MPFELSLLPKFDLQRTEIDGVRHYILPSGKVVPSVTTVLSQKTDKSHIEAWKARVGEEEAARVSFMANSRGTIIHEMIEKYLLNEELPKKIMPSSKMMFRDMKKYLDRISTVYGLEYMLYSENLNSAGTADCLGVFDGVPSIIDFKTSKRIKKDAWINNYYYQATAYSIMVEELLNIKLEQIVIIMGVDAEHALLFVKHRDEYIDQVRELFGGTN